MKAMSLIELIVVLVIAAILSAMVWAVWPGSRFHVPVQARQIANAIRHLRNYAMTHSGVYRVSFNPSASTMTLSDSNGNCIAAFSSFANQSCTTTLVKGVSMRLTNIPLNYISFDSRGRPYRDNGSTLLTRIATITLTASDGSATVSITPQSGMVSVS